MITLNIQLVNKIIILFAATNKCQFFVSSYQRALQKSQEGKIRYILCTFLLALFLTVCYAEDHIENSKSQILKLRDGDHYLGNKNAKVTIVLYSSLSCPGCVSFHENILPKIEKDYIDSGKVLYIFRDYPSNEPALYGAILANCFDNSYLELIDVLFKSQSRWAFRKDFKQMLKNIARLSGFSSDETNKCFEDKGFADKIQIKAYNDMKALNLNQTPTIYINNEFIINIGDYNNYVKIIDKHLNK